MSTTITTEGVLGQVQGILVAWRLDLRGQRSFEPAGGVFWGCILEPPDKAWIVERGGTVVAAPPELEVCDGSGLAPYLARAEREAPLRYAWALHDQAEEEALAALLGTVRPVAIVGGATLPRSGDTYRRAARLAKRLAETSYALVTTIGTGVAEAVTLGAALAGWPDAELPAAIRFINEQSPSRRAFRERWPARIPAVVVGLGAWSETPGPGLYTHLARGRNSLLHGASLVRRARHGVVVLPGCPPPLSTRALLDHQPPVFAPVLILGEDPSCCLRALRTAHPHPELVRNFCDERDLFHAIQDHQPSWYLRSDDPDEALETHLRRTLRLRDNVRFFRHAGTIPTEADGPLPATALGAWLLERLTDDWVDPARLPEAVRVMGDTVVYRCGEALWLERSSGTCRWEVELDD